MSLLINDRMYWPNGKKKALTLSYDDGVDQDIKFIDLLDKYGIKCTFNINSGLLGQSGNAIGSNKATHNKLSDKELVDIYKNHEIAAHGLFHSCITAMDTARAAHEILSCRRDLEQILNRPVTGYAYAFGAIDDNVAEAAKLCGLSYARTIKSTNSFELPADFIQWDPTCHHDDENIFKLLNDFLDKKPLYSFVSPVKLMYIWGHSYEFDVNQNWSHIEKVLSLSAHHDDVWYATNIDICQYVKMYHNLIFSVDSSCVFNPNSSSVWLGGMFSDDVIEVKPGAVEKLIPPAEM